jgi:subtilase family serine protease
MITPRTTPGFSAGGTLGPQDRTISCGEANSLLISRPIKAPGTTFSVTDTIKNLGPVASGPSTTRYYLSLDPVKSVGDTLLGGSRAVPALAAAASHSGTVTVTIPATTPLNAYFLLACADDLGQVAESNEGNNCIASPTAIVTVTRPDLAESAVSAPPARG